MVKQLKKQIASTQDEEQLEKLKHHLHIAETDSLYANYFPLREKYVSLYSAVLKDTSDTQSAEEAKAEAKAEAKSSNLAARSLNSERPEFWTVIEKAAEKGQPALQALRDRKPASETRDQPAKNEGKTESKKSSKHKAVEEKPEDSGDESDGGFFEAA